MKTNRFFLLLCCLATLAACTPEELPGVEPTQKVFFNQYTGASLDGDTTCLVDFTTGNTSLAIKTRAAFTLSKLSKCSVLDGQIDVIGTNKPFSFTIEQYATVYQGTTKVWSGRTGEAFTLGAGSYEVSLSTYAFIKADERFVADLTLKVEDNRGVSFTEDF